MGGVEQTLTERYAAPPAWRRRLLLGGVVKQLHRTLRWDPAAEEFVGDDEANRLLSIAKRAPWRI